MSSVIRIENIRKTFANGKEAVKGISFSAEAGEIFCLIGPNGAGKTTTLRMLGTLLAPDSGKIYIDGTDIVADPWRARKITGFMTSGLRLEECFSADYLFDFFSKLYGLDKSTCRKRKEELFQLFGINEFARIPLSKLSDGMKQKVSLAVSVAHDPSVIIYDEPTNGLDIIGARTVTDFLLSQKEAGKTIIMSSHIFELIEKTGTKVGILINGRLAACGSLDEICKGRSLEERFFEIADGESAEEGCWRNASLK